jgi:hypothetical protein
VRAEELRVARETARFEQYPACSLDDQLSWGSDRHTTAGAVEQQQTQVLFEYLNASGESGLRKMHALGSSGEASLFGQRDQMIQLANGDFMHLMETFDQHNAFEL